MRSWRRRTMSKTKQILKNAYQRDYRARTGNASTKKYEKSINGFLVRSYRNMLNRVLGIYEPKAHIYKGKEILSKEEFYEFSRNDPQFLKLYKNWVNNNFDRRLSPSVNRINTAKGYTLDNIEWMTHSQNSSLASVSRRQKNPELQVIKKLLKIGGTK
jgi:hypothetical protein